LISFPEIRDEPKNQAGSDKSAQAKLSAFDL
jgi:hypothetical protein